jgi:hypothetical protein
MRYRFIISGYAIIPFVLLIASFKVAEHCFVLLNLVLRMIIGY